MLVLSLFPGIGLLDMAFEEEGFCVVRGPDVLWGGDVKRFHPPGGRFDGVIGGPPCQPFSQLVHMVKANGYEPRHENLIPELERIVAEAKPAWFVMEEVRGAPLPNVPGYRVHEQMVNARHFGSTQNRERRISFGTHDGRALRLESQVFEPLDWDFAVTGDARRRPVAMLAGGKPNRNHHAGEGLQEDRRDVPGDSERPEGSERVSVLCLRSRLLPGPRGHSSATSERARQTFAERRKRAY